MLKEASRVYPTELYFTTCEREYVQVGCSLVASQLRQCERENG